MRVDRAHVARERALHARAEAASEQLRQIRMKESDHRHMARTRRRQSAPCRMKHVADLDEVGLELEQHVLPGTHREGQAVIKGSRQANAGDGTDTAAHQSGLCAGHEQRMTMRGVRAQPILLGG